MRRVAQETLNNCVRRNHLKLLKFQKGGKPLKNDINMMLSSIPSVQYSLLYWMVLLLAKIKYKHKHLHTHPHYMIDMVLWVHEFSKIINI